MNPKTRQQLMGVSTATLCTALFRRGLRNQFIQDVRPVRGMGQQSLPNMVGPAFTLRCIPAREDLNPIGVFQDRAHPQRQPVEECPAGAVFVIEGRSILGLYPPMDEQSRIDFAAWRPAMGR